MKELEKLSFAELKKTAKEKGIKIPRTTTKEILLKILKEEQEKEKEKLTQKELLKIIMDNFYNEENNTIELKGFDWGEVNVDFSGQNINGNLIQEKQTINGILSQDYQEIKGYLYQDYQEISKSVYQIGQKIKINLIQERQNVFGKVSQLTQTINGDLHQKNEGVLGSVFYRSINKKDYFKGIVSQYDMKFSNKKITIGCQTHTREEWNNFSNKDILKFGGKDGLRFWKKLKPILVEMRELPAPTPAPAPKPKPVNFDILTGTAMPGAAITITLPNGTNVTTTTNKNGQWTIKSSPVKVGKNEQ